MRFPRTMLLAMSLGLAVPFAAYADVGTGAPAAQTEQGVVGGPERPGSAVMMGPPHAPTGVGQSPVLLNADDQRALHTKRVVQPSNLRLPSDTSGHYDLNAQGTAAK